MIEETGTIIELRDGQVALVQCQRNSACENCPSSGACKTGDDGETMQVEALNVIWANVGDKVKVVTSTKHFLQSSFMLYIVPIIGLLIGALLGQTVGEMGLVTLDSSLLSALSGVFFFIGTFLLIRLLTRGLKKEIFMPKIIQKL